MLSIKLIIIDGERLSVANTKNGIIAFDNRCPHQNEPLSKGLIAPNGDVVCALHYYRFSPKTGLEVSKRCNSLKFYPVVVNDKGVFLDL